MIAALGLAAALLAPVCTFDDATGHAWVRRLPRHQWSDQRARPACMGEDVDFYGRRAGVCGIEKHT